MEAILLSISLVILGQVCVFFNRLQKTRLAEAEALLQARDEALRRRAQVLASLKLVIAGDGERIVGRTSVRPLIRL